LHEIVRKGYRVIPLRCGICTPDAVRGQHHRS
jgi:hypothetical protein